MCPLSRTALVRLTPAALVVALVACAPQEAAERVGDAVFLDAGAIEAGGADVGTGLALACALGGDCGNGTPCCPAETPRCVPSASGSNRCVAAGPVPLGAPCGLADGDDCGLDALCLAALGRSATCHRVCVDASGCEGSECVVFPVPGSQTVGLCSNDPQ